MMKRLPHLVLVALFSLLVAVVSFAEAPLPSPEPTAPILTYSYDLYGSNLSDITREAALKAIKSSVGRVYFSDYMIRGRALLDSYLAQNWSSYVARSKVKKTEIRGGRRFAQVEMAVDLGALYKDLAEKRFFYRPALRPLFYIFLQETIDGESTVPAGRLRIQEILDKRQYRYPWEEGFDKPTIPVAEREEVVIADPLPRQNAGRSAAMLQEASNQAQRHEVEIFFTGSFDTKTSREEKVYFEDYTYVETSATLQLVRSDTAEVMAELHTITSAGNAVPQKAVEASHRAAVDALAPKLLDIYTGEWPNSVLQKANVLVMITGIAPDTLPLFRQMLKQSAPEATLYVRSVYADVAVLALGWPEGSESRLGDLLRSTFYPAFRATEVAPGRLMLEALPDKGSTSL